MYCKNCGAKLEPHAIRCGYCGSEIEKRVEQIVNQNINQKKNQAYRLNNIPDRIHRGANKASKYAVLGLGAIILVVALLAVLVGIFGKSASELDDSEDKMNKHIQKLEKYYQEGDYKAISEYMDRLSGSYKAVYRKYSYTKSLYDDYTYARDSVKNDMSFINAYIETETNQSQLNILDYALWKLFSVESATKKADESGYMLDEEEVTEYFYEKADNILRNVLLLEDEDIEEGIRMFDEGARYTEYDEISALCIHRIKEQE